MPTLQAVHRSISDWLKLIAFIFQRRNGYINKHHPTQYLIVYLIWNLVRIYRLTLDTESQFYHGRILQRFAKDTAHLAREGDILGVVSALLLLSHVEFRDHFYRDISRVSEICFQRLMCGACSQIRLNVHHWYALWQSEGVYTSIWLSPEIIAFYAISNV